MRNTVRIIFKNCERNDIILWRTIFYVDTVSYFTRISTDCRPQDGVLNANDLVSDDTGFSSKDTPQAIVLHGIRYLLERLEF